MGEAALKRLDVRQQTKNGGIAAAA